MSRFLSRSRMVATGVGTAMLVLAAAVPALAHVTVNPRTATQGGYAALTFRVPTESDTSSTTRLKVVFPAEAPLASVSVKPHPGWSYAVTKVKPATPVSAHGQDVTEVVGSIVWTADDADAAIKPGEFDEFQISAGPLPNIQSMTFKALQTYSDGEIVRWIEPAGADGSQPDHPAPVLTLTPAAAAPTTAPAPSATAMTVTAGSATPADPSSSTSSSAAGWIGLAAGLIGAGTGGLALRRTRTSARR